MCGMQTGLSAIAPRTSRGTGVLQSTVQVEVSQSIVAPAPAATLMPWIESHQMVGHHPKTIRLAELLRVSLPTAVGHVHYLWWWALDFAPTGAIRTSPTVLARACEWRGSAEKFVQALVAAG